MLNLACEEVVTYEQNGGGSLLDLFAGHVPIRQPCRWRGTAGREWKA